MYIDFHTHKTIVESNVFSICSHSVVCPLVGTSNYWSVGLHPWDIANVDIAMAMADVEALLSRDDVLMVGECGLDRCTAVPMVVQQQVMERHIQLAEQYAKPLVIHCVRAYNELIAMHKHHNPKQPWVVHGFANNADIACRLSEAGILISFGRNLLAPNGNATKVLVQMHDMLFFLETDNSTISIAEVYAKAAEVLQTDVYELQITVKHSLEEILNSKII